MGETLWRRRICTIFAGPSNPGPQARKQASEGLTCLRRVLGDVGTRDRTVLSNVHQGIGPTGDLAGDAIVSHSLLGFVVEGHDCIRGGTQDECGGGSQEEDGEKQVGGPHDACVRGEYGSIETEENSHCTSDS